MNCWELLQSSTGAAPGLELHCLPNHCLKLLCTKCVEVVLGDI